MYLGSSLVPRRTPAPLYHNLQIWDLECEHTGMPLVWPLRNGKMNGVVCEQDSLSTRNMFGKTKLLVSKCQV